MNLTVTERAQEYIAKAGGIITMRIEKRLIPSCSKLQTADVPVVRLGAPEEHEQNDFKVFDVDGVRIYTHNSLLMHNDQAFLSVDTQLNLFDRTLVVYGLPASNANCGNCTSC